MLSSWVVNAVDHSAPPQMGTLALFRSTSPHFFSQFHMEVSHDVFSPASFQGSTSQLLPWITHKLSPGTASTIVNLAFINSCLYLGTHSYFLRIICFMTSSRSVYNTISVMTLFPSLLASHAFLAWMVSFATLTSPWLIAFMN